MKMYRSNLVLAFILISCSLSGQDDSLKTRPPVSFSGSAAVTTKGISTIPNLTLGKPAAIFDFSIGRRLSFDPNIRFSLEGRPWSFLFWFRYKLIQAEKFRLNIGAHPALSFRLQNITTINGQKEFMAVYRYLAAEVAPSYMISKNVSIGPYWLYSHGIEEELTQNTHLVSIRAGISNIRMVGDFFLRLNPQVYYLNMDNTDGFYINTIAAISRKDFPFSVTCLVNNPIRTNILTGNEFLWNVSLIYSFSK